MKIILKDWINCLANKFLLENKLLLKERRFYDRQWDENNKSQNHYLFDYLYLLKFLPINIGWYSTKLSIFDVLCKFIL